MVACLEVIMWASNLTVYPMLIGLPTHCCIIKLSCGDICEGL